MVRDTEQAHVLFRKAAEQGHARAQVFIGHSYSLGKDGLPLDKTQGNVWYRKAAVQGDIAGQAFLGASYDYAGGAIQSNVLAHMWYNIAASNGHEDSGEWRDLIGAGMTRGQLADAQARAIRCVESKYKDC